MRIRKLTEQGRKEFRDWLATRKSGDVPPSGLVDGDEQTEVIFASFQFRVGKLDLSRYGIGYD